MTQHFWCHKHWFAVGLKGNKEMVGGKRQTATTEKKKKKVWLHENVSGLDTSQLWPWLTSDLKAITREKEVCTSENRSLQSRNLLGTNRFHVCMTVHTSFGSVQACKSLWFSLQITIKVCILINAGCPISTPISSSVVKLRINIKVNYC